MKNILLCFGTRPEAIKMAPVLHELQKRNISFKVCVTAQHREMLDQVLEFFEIIPDYDLNLMKAGQTLNTLSANIFSAIDEVFDDWLGLRHACFGHSRRAQPGLRQAQSDVVLVHGDTTTSAMVALAAFHRGIKVGHIEAGLRTYNKTSPFPEEVNRQITAKIADYHFAPTEKAYNNLLQEQIPREQIYVTGNTVVDALQWAVKKLQTSPLPIEIQKLNVSLSLSKTINKKLILVTGHRRENFGQGLSNICTALKEISRRNDVGIIYPVHLNPQVREPVQEILGEFKNIHLIAPVSYPAMLWLMQECNFIISDSGGIQEEAPTFKKAVLVTRDFSERMEGVAAGFSILVGTDKEKIILEAEKLFKNPPSFERIENPYGDGKAAERIVEFLVRSSTSLS